MPEDEPNRFNLPDPPSEEEIRRRLSHNDPEPKRERGLPEPPDFKHQRKSPSANNPTKPGSLRGAAYGLNLVYTMISPVAAGFGIGMLVDRSRGGHSETGQTVGMIVGLFVGFGLMLFLASRTNDSTR